MRWVVYNALFVVCFLLALPRFLFRMWRRGGYRRGFLQRFGRYDEGVAARLAAGRRIWVHAVSVGEAQVALRFMQEIRSRRPGARFVLTVNTSTAHRLAEAALPPEDVLLYFPLDWPAVVRRVLAAVRPQALVLVESELWPNVLRLTAGRGIPLVLVNGRISDSAFRGYRLLRTFFAPVVSRVDLLCVQTDRDRDRLRSLGAPPERIRVLGSAKYDLRRPDADKARRIAGALGALGFRPGDPVLVGGSTWPGEEQILLDVLRRLRPRFPGLRLILVPRHAERGDEVEAQIRSSGLTFVRRSRPGASDTARPDVVLADTTGELACLYEHASVIFVGKSLTARGGQNIIEPAAAGKAVIVGPHMENFAEVARDFRAAGALRMVRDAAEFEAAVAELLGDAAAREGLAARASDLVRRMSGVVPATLDAIMPVLFRGVGGGA